MILFLQVYLAGALTIISPCILPVLPFVFARANQPFLRSGLPVLLGMAVTFGGAATRAAVGGGWAVHAKGYGRIIALAVLASFGVCCCQAAWRRQPGGTAVSHGDLMP